MAETKMSKQEIADKRLSYFFSSFYTTTFGGMTDYGTMATAMTRNVLDYVPIGKFIKINEEVTDEAIKESGENTLKRYSIIYKLLSTCPIHDVEDDTDEVLFEMFSDAYYALLKYLKIYVGELELRVNAFDGIKSKAKKANISEMFTRMKEKAADEYDDEKNKFLDYFIELYPDQEKRFKEIR